MAESEFPQDALFPWPVSSAYSISTFDGLTAWVSSLPNPQEDGEPCAVSSVAGPYEEVVISAPFRRDDQEGRKLAERCVVLNFALRISAMLRDDKACIYWRERPEWDTWDWDRPIKYHADGPDYDPLTDKRCTMNKDWALLKAYARLAVKHG